VTLHGGIYGWDRRNWTLVARTPTSVTYKHVDTADEGFPGNVTAFVRIQIQVSEVKLNYSTEQATHSVFNGGVLKSSVRAFATEKVSLLFKMVSVKIQKDDTYYLNP